MNLEFTEMRHPKKIQIELLILTTPRPFGKGLKLIQAAKLLHIHYQSAKDYMYRFRGEFPNRWQEIAKIREYCKTQPKRDRQLKKAINFRNMTFFGSLDIANDRTAEDGVKFDVDSFSTAYMKIREKF